MRTRAELFRYAGLDVQGTILTGHYELDGRQFSERVSFEGVGDLGPAARAVAELWYVIAGLSYYKAGAARRVELGSTRLGPKGRTLLHAALRDGLGEFAYRNDLDLDDVVIAGGVEVERYSPALDPNRVLTPFGGGIDSVVTVTRLNERLEQSLFIVSPSAGRFHSLEATATVTGLPVVRASRTLDEQVLHGDPTFYNGHVPVTAMVTLLAALAAVASGRGGVVMSNEHSASVPNLYWRDRPVNHQWSKSLDAEVLIGDALGELVGDGLVVASFLRDRSELWVAEAFASEGDYHRVFRSCNRAFAQDNAQRAASWCGECDKCLFIDLVLAPFLARERLREIFGGEPLAERAREAQLRTLVGLGEQHKPFECVGDPDESAVALRAVSALAEWRDAPQLAEIAARTSPERTFDELLRPQGPRRVPAHWLR
ncbi:MAG TPA: hypothetical protein VMV53_10660 [Acidimicrobiales bacterium]|nr:hypothetical protein [Acidimicrobiales bacterium]